ncbi:MAG: DUF3795 domain-containing protein [Demequinaceae bacterium]|nr:DUF3795 domain-containing protein [Demequinaceae bacterium]
MAFFPDGYCGLYCGSCPDFLATKTGNTHDPETSSCQGCKSGVTAPWCTDCALKTCAQKRAVEFCSECPDFPCPEYQDFIDHAKDPYVVEIGEYLATIKEAGKEEWLTRMKRRWSCPSCETDATWWDLSCTGCGTPLNGYEKPPEET